MDDNRDLVGLSRQVLYELEMTEFLAKRLVDLTMGTPQPGWRQRFDTPDPLIRHTFEANAMLESLLIHVRALTSFLFDAPSTPAKREANLKRGKPSGVDDAFAEDYFDAPIPDWRKHPAGRGRRPRFLTEESLNRISREIAHITYHRAAFEDAGSNWSAYGLYGDIADAMERFAARVARSKVSPDFHARVYAALPLSTERWRSRRAAGSRYSVSEMPVATQGLSSSGP